VIGSGRLQPGPRSRFGVPTVRRDALEYAIRVSPASRQGRAGRGQYATAGLRIKEPARSVSMSQPVCFRYNRTDSPGIDPI